MGGRGLWDGADRALVVIRDTAGRQLGTGFVADHQGTVVTGHETVEGAAGLVLETATGRTCEIDATEAVTPLPALALALLRTEGLDTDPLPVTVRARVEPGTYVRLAACGWREARVLGVTPVTYTTAGGRRHHLGEALELAIGTTGRDALRPGGGAAGGPVLDATTGTVLGILGPSLRPSGDRGTGLAVRLAAPGPADAPGGASRAGAVSDADDAPLAAVLARNAATVPSYGVDLNLAGVLESAAVAERAAAAEGAGGPSGAHAVAGPRVPAVADRACASGGSAEPVVAPAAGLGAEERSRDHAGPAVSLLASHGDDAAPGGTAEAADNWPGEADAGSPVPGSDPRGGDGHTEPRAACVPAARADGFPALAAHSLRSAHGHASVHGHHTMHGHHSMHDHRAVHGHHSMHGHRAVHEHLADWLQTARLDPYEALGVLFCDDGARPGTPDGQDPPRHADPHQPIGPVVQALLLLADRQGAVFLSGWLAAVLRGWEADPGSRWAGPVLARVSAGVSEPVPYAGLFRDLADRVVALRRERRPVPEEFGPPFWTGLRLPYGERVDLLRRLVVADEAASGNPRYLDAAAYLLAAEPVAVQPLLVRWFDDERPLPARPRATVAAAAQALLHTHRHLALDDLVETLADSPHRPHAAELLTALAEEEPSAVCRAVGRWAHGEDPARRAAAATYGRLAAPHARTGDDRALLCHAALALLSRPAGPADPALRRAAHALLDQLRTAA